MTEETENANVEMQIMPSQTEQHQSFLMQGDRI